MNYVIENNDKTVFHDFTANIFVDLIRRLFIMNLYNLLVIGVLSVLSSSAYNWTAV